MWMPYYIAHHVFKAISKQLSARLCRQVNRQPQSNMGRDKLSYIRTIIP